MPKDAGPDDPPCNRHNAWLLKLKMQDAPAIKMSRRGYIVLALDMYDHGDSAGLMIFLREDTSARLVTHIRRSQLYV